METTDSTQYTRIDRTISFGRANLLGIVIVFPLIFFPFGLYVLIWGGKNFLASIQCLTQHPLILLAGLFLLTGLHEWTHGLTWQLTGGLKWQDIHYGFNWKTLTPYAHPKKAMDIRAYRWGGVMPGILTGLLPAVTGLVIGSGVVYIVGVAMTAAAAGDMMVLWLLRKDKSPALVEDHPSKAGCYVLVEKEEEQQ